MRKTPSDLGASHQLYSLAPTIHLGMVDDREKIKAGKSKSRNQDTNHNNNNVTTTCNNHTIARTIS